LKSDATLNYEATPSYTYTVQWVSPRSSGGATETATMTLNVINLPESPVVNAGQVYSKAEGSTGVIDSVVATGT